MFYSLQTYRKSESKTQIQMQHRNNWNTWRAKKCGQRIILLKPFLYVDLFGETTIYQIREVANKDTNMHPSTPFGKDEMLVIISKKKKWNVS